MDDTRLLDIVPASLKRGLMPAETLVLDKALRGAWADLHDDEPDLESFSDEEWEGAMQADELKIDRPDNAPEWNDERIIRAEFLRWIMTESRAIALVHEKGVCITGARITGSIDLEGAKIARPLMLAYSRIDEDIVLKRAECPSISLHGSHVGSIIADGLTTNKGGLFLRDGFRAKGEVRLVGAQIHGALGCGGGTFDNQGGAALDARNMRVFGPFLWQTKETKGTVDLRDAQVDMLIDDMSSYPAQDQLFLDGFEYNSFTGNETPTSVEERLKWIRLQPPRPFKPQPYEQLTKVFRSMGREADALLIMRAMYEDMG